MRIVATGVNSTNSTQPADPSQTSLCLDPAVISSGFDNDGQGNITNPGQGLFSVLPSVSGVEYELISNAVPSPTSSNNWINFCKTVDLPLTNGQQITSTCTVPFIASKHSIDLAAPIE